MDLEQRLLGLELSTLPVWVTDPEGPRQVWANAPALALWGASDRAEFYARDIKELSAAARARLTAVLDKLRAGSTVEEQWTFYPQGKPVTLTIVLSAVALDDGRQGLLQQGFVPRERPDADLLRGVEALRHTPVVVALLDPGGDVLFRNPAAVRVFGPSSPFAAWFVDPGDAPKLLHATTALRHFEGELWMRTSAGERWHALDARITLDPVTGSEAILLQQIDETARRGAEHIAEAKTRLADELKQALKRVDELVVAQSQQILALSAPIIEVAAGVLAVPLIGTLNQDRSQEIAARLLQTVTERRASTVLLDMTGMDVTDAACVRPIQAMARALRLLGAHTIVTGISPALARLWTLDGGAITDILACRSIREGIAACQQIKLAARGRPSSGGLRP